MYRDALLLRSSTLCVKRAGIAAVQLYIIKDLWLQPAGYDVMKTV